MTSIIAKRPEITKARLRLGLSLDSLAEKCDLTKETLCKVENGRKVRPCNAAKICSALECNFDEIFCTREG